MTPRTIMASTSLVFILGLAACAPTPSAPPPPADLEPHGDPMAGEPEPMAEPLDDDMGAAPMPID